MECDGVFEGGGVRGIGLVGAAHAFEQNGYTFRNLAGSSAGAIVASLLAAGYTTAEMHSIMSTLNFEQFKQRTVWHDFGMAGKIISATTNFGIYSATAFENWLARLLSQKGIRTFADLPKRLRVTASNITEGRLLVLPDDLARFGLNPKTFSVATAVRMSMSIPIFYEPYELKDSNGNIYYIVDGGILSNYPAWILDDGISRPDYPIFGFRFIKPQQKNKNQKPNFKEYLKQIIETFTEAHDEVYQSRVQGDSERTIHISTRVQDKYIGATDFEISQHQANTLFNNGYAAAIKFLNTWNFDNWILQFRN